MIENCPLCGNKLRHIDFDKSHCRDCISCFLYITYNNENNCIRISHSLLQNYGHLTYEQQLRMLKMKAFI